jgi:hypothetical protein
VGILYEKGRRYKWKKQRILAGKSMSVCAPIMMKMGFVVVPSGTDPEGSTTKAIFVVNLIGASRKTFAL